MKARVEELTGDQRGLYFARAYSLVRFGSISPSQEWASPPVSRGCEYGAGPEAPNPRGPGGFYYRSTPLSGGSRADHSSDTSPFALAFIAGSAPCRRSRAEASRDGGFVMRGFARRAEREEARHPLMAICGNRSGRRIDGSPLLSFRGAGDTRLPTCYWWTSRGRPQR